MGKIHRIPLMIGIGGVKEMSSLRPRFFYEAGRYNSDHPNANRVYGCVNAGG